MPVANNRITSPANTRATRITRFNNDTFAWAFARLLTRDIAKG